MGLFKKKEHSFNIINRIWITEEAKWNGCIEETKSKPETIFIAWFDETLQQLETIFNKENLPVTNIYLTRQVANYVLQNKRIVFIEHHPLRSKEQTFFDQLHIPEIQIFSALDEPLFKQFGGDKIITMMKQLGMKETESFENKMISNSIGKMQEKIENKISIEQSAHSQTEWLSRNFKD